MHHEPVAERLLAHLRGRYGIDPVAAARLSVHKTYVFRIDRTDGGPWVGRAFPPVRQGNDGGSPAERRSARVSAPIEVPEDIVERVRTLCLALPR